MVSPVSRGKVLTPFIGVITVSKNSFKVHCISGWLINEQVSKGDDLKVKIVTDFSSIVGGLSIFRTGFFRAN